uniref:Uncharacterized protein n=1 Tax=Arundo donax TaxID=35708 RepID=A0A0A8Z3H8_ARUDO
MNCYTPEDSHSKKQSNEFPEQNILDELMTFDHIDYGKHLPKLPGPNPVIPINPLKHRSSTGCIASDYNGSLTCVQIPEEPEKTGCSTDFDYGITESQFAPLGSAFVSGHPIFDGNPSTSGTIHRSMKMELPSFQCPDNDPSNDWLYACTAGSPIEQADTFIESPGSVSLKSESISSQNIGLDAIVQKGGLDKPTKYQGVFEVSVPLSYNQVSQLNAYPMRHSSSYVLGNCELEGCPFGEIQASKPPSSSDAIFAVSKYYPDARLSDKYPPSWPDTGMLDASLEASLLNEGSVFSNGPSIIQTLNSIFDEDTCKEANLSTAGHWLDPSTWKSMPDTCNMPDFPNP